jgi:hypothetical protein
MNKNIQGKRNRLSGANFERRVRKDLEKKGFIVIKNPNNIIKDKFTHGGSKYNPVTKRLLMNSGGFPDFICFKKVNNQNSIIGVECKSNGYLSRVEKEKCHWFLKHKTFEDLLIASKLKIKNKIHISYKYF